MRAREFITEKRKNPKQNPKISVNQAIISAYDASSYSDRLEDQNCFVSFTSIDKLGINPNSSFETPIGIYAYPASYVIGRIGETKSPDHLPYAGEEPYASIFSGVGNMLLVSDMSTTDAMKYYPKIGEYYASKSGMPWKQSVDIVERFINDAHKSAKFPDLIGGRFWYVTMEVANLLSKPKSIYTKSDNGNTVKSGHHTGPTIWNDLLRFLGIDYIVDQGTGIIHTNEPHQALFLSTKAIDNVKRVYNKYSAQDYNFNKSMGDHINDILKSAVKLEPYQWLSQYGFSELNKIKDLKIMKKFIDYDPFLFRYFEPINISEEIATYAVSMIGNLWQHVPKNVRTYDMFKIALDNITDPQDRTTMINWDYGAKDKIQTRLILDYIETIR